MSQKCIWMPKCIIYGIKLKIKAIKRTISSCRFISNKLCIWNGKVCLFKCLLFTSHAILEGFMAVSKKVTKKNNLLIYWDKKQTENDNLLFRMYVVDLTLIETMLSNKADHIGIALSVIRLFFRKGLRLLFRHLHSVLSL